ncbi:MAG: DUF4062 domain-containing protein [Clostridia bacterium]|nr:DUF4062 domain-containing protein [Clostridia bacterium]
MKSFFISSTFKDMQAERDLLHQEIFPQVRQKLKKYGEDIQELDLRWGVDTSLMSEEESGYHVIESCIDSIDRCRPYMIILVGERYGWIPGSDTVASTHDERLARWYSEPISITQMEILYGALEQDNLERCIFCFRDENFSDNIPAEYRGVYQAESEQHREKLTSLKEKIRTTSGAIIFEYHPTWDEQTNQVGGLEDFKNRLTELLWNMLEAEVTENQTICPEEQILNNASLTVSRYMSTYVPRENLTNPAVLNGRGAYLYHGEGGCGKSAFLSSICDGAASAGYDVFIYYCGNENCSSVDTFLDVLIYWLRRRNGSCSSMLGANTSRAQKMKWILDLLNAERTCSTMFLIDAADQMEEDITDILCLISKAVIRDPVDEHPYGLVVTSLDSFYKKHLEQLEFSDFGCHKIGDLLPTEVISLAQMHAAHRGKHLDSKAQNAIRNKQGCSNPYYLSLVLQQLFIMNEEDFKAAEALAPGMEGLSLYMEQLIEQMPEDITEMTLNTLDFTARRMSRRFSDIKGDFKIADPMSIFSLLASSRSGLTLQELEEILKMQGLTLLPMAVQCLLSFLYDAFCENRDGRWDFSHRLLRESLLSQLSSEQYKSNALLLCRYMQQKANISESLYYALRSENRDEISRCLHTAMSCRGSELDSCLGTYHAYLLEVGKETALASLHQAPDSYSWLLAKTILADTDRAVKNHGYWLELLCAAKNDVKSKKTLYYVHLAELSLLKYLDDAQPYLTSWDTVDQLYFSIAAPEPDDTREYILTLLAILSERRFNKKWSAVDKRIRELNKKTDIGDESLKETINWLSVEVGMLLVFWQAVEHVESEKVLERLKSLHQHLHIMRSTMQLKSWETCKPQEKMSYHMIYSQYVQLAEEYNNHNQYSYASALIKDITPWFEQRITLFPTIDERIQYANLLNSRINCTKADFAQKYINAFREQYEYLSGLCPLELFRRRLGYSYYSQAYALERVTKHEFDHKRKLLESYREAIQIYDSLLEGKTEEESLSILDMLSYLRYKRIVLRLSLDIWNWKDDKDLMFAKKGMYGAALMEEDLQKLTEHSVILYRHEGTLQRLYELAWSYLYGVQYYDRHQEKEKAFKWCQMLLDCDRELLSKDPNGGKWTRIVFYLNIAECYVRYDNPSSAADLAGKCLAIFGKIDPEWIVKRKYEEKQRQYLIRSYLILIQTATPDTLSDAEECLRLAWVQINKCDETQKALAAQNNVFRSGLKQAMAELYHECGMDYKASELLQEAARYCPVELTPTLIFQAEEDLQNQLRFLKSHTLLGFIKKDTEILKTIISQYQRIVEKKTTDCDASYRPLLLAEARRIEQFYKTELPGEELPEELLYILLVNDKARKKDKWGKYSLLVKEKQKQIEAWEASHSDITDTEYLSLLKEASSLQSDMTDLVPKDSPEYAELFAWTISIVEKLCAHYWEVDNVKFAVNYECFIAYQFSASKELIEKIYTPNQCWEHWCLLREKRNSSPYISRNVQGDWIQLTDFGINICYRMYEQTDDTHWLLKAAEEAISYRSYMSDRKDIDADDVLWTQEKIHYFYNYEQDAYLKMKDDSSISESEWLPAYLKSLEEQLHLNILVPDSFYREKLEVLYGLQASGISDQNGLQKAIDQVSEAQNGKDYKFYYYMQKAAHDLDGDTQMEEVMAYIKQLQEKDESSKK